MVGFVLGLEEGEEEEAEMVQLLSSLRCFHQHLQPPSCFSLPLQPPSARPALKCLPFCLKQRELEGERWVRGRDANCQVHSTAGERQDCAASRWTPPTSKMARDWLSGCRQGRAGAEQLETTFIKTIQKHKHSFAPHSSYDCVYGNYLF